MPFRTSLSYLALSINWNGEKEVLGLWIAETKGAKFWLSVMTELKNRGLQDIFIACTDGLKGFPDAIEAVYPQSCVLCARYAIHCVMSVGNNVKKSPLIFEKTMPLQH